MVVSVVVTNRCNYSCGYCDRWDGRGEQMAPEELAAYLDEMAAMGTRRVIFTGGEPLVRKDLLERLDQAVALGMKVQLNTNGVLVPRFLERLGALASMMVSIDGDLPTHDRVRGPGAYDAAAEAIRVMRRAHPHVRVRISATMSSESLGAEDALLDLARELGVTVFFQPAEHRQLGGEGSNALAPPTARYRDAIDHLLLEKRRGAPIQNSASALAYLRGWPDAPALPCAGAKLFCRLDHDARVMICGRMGEYEESHSARDGGFRRAFLSLHEAKCPTCWCASRVEVNQAFALRPDALLGLATAAT